MYEKFGFQREISKEKYMWAMGMIIANHSSA